jgi:hypothetical protein
MVQTRWCSPPYVTVRSTGGAYGSAARVAFERGVRGAAVIAASPPERPFDWRQATDWGGNCST